MNSTKQSELVVVEQLKGSLLSSVISSRVAEDTVYSYLEEEEGLKQSQLSKMSLRRSKSAIHHKLKKERLINREYQDKLKCMQAEIEALN